MRPTSLRSLRLKFPQPRPPDPLSATGGPAPYEGRHCRKLAIGGCPSPVVVLHKKLWELRKDLAYEEEERLEVLLKIGAGLALGKNQWRRALALCHQTGLVEEYVGID
jgi:hypothetical protein